MSFKAQWTWEFDVPREALWRYVADTDWVNQHAGLPAISIRFEPDPLGGTRKFGSFRQGPMVVAWEEMPTIWQVPEYFSVERRYSKGPLKLFINRTVLEPVTLNRTRIAVDVELQAASPLLDPLLPLLAAHGKRGANRAFRLAAKLAVSDGASEAAASPEMRDRFDPLLSRGIDPTVVETLAKFVDTAEDRDLHRMRPYELADRWRLNRREVLRAFLTATRAGLFNLSWSVICPGCRGPSPGMDGLDDLQRGYHCPACNLPFDAAFDRSVEVTFDARPLGRTFEDGMFCLASPQRSAHVYAQIAPIGKSTEKLSLALKPGSYDINAIGVGLAPFVVTEDEAHSHELRASLEGSSVIVPHEIGSGEIAVSIENALDREVIVRIEDGRWPDTVVTAAQVTALQEFRDLFSSQVLSPGLELGIETIAILFTDLVGSTAMYSKTGDAPAFRLVTDHFEVLREIVSRHEGAIVKTIGDAVMAAFVNPLNCLRAAIALDSSVMHLEYEEMPLRLRVGFHAGPCIAMRANDRIDYFGTTVNLAARLQSKAGAGEVTMARTDAERPDIAAELRARRASVSFERLDIKGFEHPVDVARVTAVEPAAVT